MMGKSERHMHNEIMHKLSELEFLLRIILQKEVHMSAELDALAAAVTENTSLDNSIVELVKGLAAQIEAAKTDPAKLQALADSLKTSSAAISAAIQANTPAAYKEVINYV